MEDGASDLNIRMDKRYFLLIDSVGSFYHLALARLIQGCRPLQ